MPTKAEWKRVHADLKAKLGFPCKLKFTTTHKVGYHSSGLFLPGCHIGVNPDADFRVPEHLILHEAAHCRDGEFGHGEGWARTLCGMYEEAGVALPRTTGFKEFAKAAGIEHKVFSKDERKQMDAITENARLVEGA